MAKVDAPRAKTVVTARRLRTIRRRLGPIRKTGTYSYARGYSYWQKGEKSAADADFAQAEKLGYKAKPDRPAGWHTANESRRLLAIIWAWPYTLLGADTILCAMANYRRYDQT